MLSLTSIFALIRLVIALVYDIAFSLIGVDDWSLKQAYRIADEHLTEYTNYLKEK